jgi:MFS family permease
MGLLSTSSIPVVDTENGGGLHAVVLDDAHSTGSNTLTLANEEDESDNNDALQLLQPTISNIPSLVCAFSASATTGGTSYAFGAYASALKANLGLTQSELNTISTAFFVAGLFSWIPGLLSDRFGTKFALSLGGCTGAASLLLYWGVAREAIPLARESLVPALSSLGVLTFLSCASITGAVFKILVAATGPGTKGSAVGAAKGYVGLGVGLYSCIFNSMRYPGESDLDFLPMAAFFFIACSTIPALILLPSKQSLEIASYQDECTGRHILTLYGSLVALATVIIANSLINLYETEVAHAGVHATQMDANVASANDQQAPNYGMGLILIVIWLGPIGVLQYLPRRKHPYTDGVVSPRRQTTVGSEGIAAFDKTVRRRKNGSRHEGNGADISQSPSRPTGRSIPIRSLTRSLSSKSLSTSSALEEKRGLLVQSISLEVLEDFDKDEAKQHVKEVQRPNNETEQNLNMLQMLLTPTAWLMLWTTTILVGAGTVVTNSVGQMVQSLGLDSKVTSASLAFFSVSQAAARVLTGSLSESALGWNTRMCCIDSGVPRPFFLLVASLLGFLAHLLLGFAQSEVTFVIGAALAGAAFGMVWPLMVLISAEVFGVAGAGQNYMFYDGVSCAAGTLLLTKFVAQEVYEYNMDRSSGSQTCIGMACYQATHLIVAGLSLTCVLSSAAMLYTSRHIYNKASLHGA